MIATLRGAGDDPVMASSDAPISNAGRSRSPWLWVSLALAVIAVGLLIWALSLRSDLDSTKQQVADLQTQVEEQGERGSTVVAAAKGVYDQLAQQLGVTTQDLAATQQQLDAAEQAASQAADAVAAADQRVTEAEDAAAKARAQADQVKARADAATTKATLAANCAKATVGALGGLFEGGSVREQASAVRTQLETITADCKSALAGT